VGQCSECHPKTAQLVTLCLLKKLGGQHLRCRTDGDEDKSVFTLGDAGRSVTGSGDWAMRQGEWVSPGNCAAAQGVTVKVPFMPPGSTSQW
jgi:hypothetical protein